MVHLLCLTLTDRGYLYYYLQVEDTQSRLDRDVYIYVLQCNQYCYSFGSLLAG